MLITPFISHTVPEVAKCLSDYFAWFWHTSLEESLQLGSTARVRCMLSISTTTTQVDKLQQHEVCIALMRQNRKNLFLSYFRRGEFTGLAVWRGRREDDGPVLVSAACLSHACLCHEVTREKGKSAARFTTCSEVSKDRNRIDYHPVMTCFKRKSFACHCLYICMSCAMLKKHGLNEG